MFGQSKRQVKDVTFVQPLEGEVYFYTPIAYSTKMNNSKGKEEREIFTDSDLALAGKLKLIFAREKMIWFEIKEEKSTTPSSYERIFALYYYPHRLVASRTKFSDEKVTLQDVKRMFDFIVTEDQPRLADVRQPQLQLAYGSIAEELREEAEASVMDEEPTKKVEGLITDSPIISVSTPSRIRKNKKSCNTS
jgi:hypothetical protein